MSLIAGNHSLIATSLSHLNQMTSLHMLSEGGFKVGIRMFTSPWFIGFFRVRIPIDSYTACPPRN